MLFRSWLAGCTDSMLLDGAYRSNRKVHWRAAPDDRQEDRYRPCAHRRAYDGFTDRYGCAGYILYDGSDSAQDIEYFYDNNGNICNRNKENK